MTHPLFTEIDKFDNWARSLYSIPQDNIGGEWECDYMEWNNIYNSFQNFISKTLPAEWSDHEKERLLYIIARDNESEYLVSMLPEQALITLSLYALDHGHTDDKWQLATVLPKLSDKQIAASLLEALVNDKDEYVNRRALMELAKVKPDKIEYYAELFWNRNIYGGRDEYQKMAVLDALKTIASNQLAKYIALAKQDGRPYLFENAVKLDSE